MKDNSEKLYYDQQIAREALNQDERFVDSKKWDLLKPSEQERQDLRHPKGLSFGSVRKEVYQSFISLWEKLISQPESFSEKDGTPIAQYIIKEEGAIYEKEFLGSTLSTILGLEQNSSTLNDAVQNCTKIYHEDFPGSYILAYKGKRLGACLLKAVQSLNDTWEVSYDFNPSITRF